MNILYGRETNKIETFRFKVNSGGDLRIKVSNGSDREVIIIFENEKFKEASHNIDEGFCKRSQWHVNGAIAEMIKTIEASYEEKAAS